MFDKLKFCSKQSIYTFPFVYFLLGYIDYRYYYTRLSNMLICLKSNKKIN